MGYEFKGHDWCELAECWGITVEEKPMIGAIAGKENETFEFGKLPEKITVRHRINRMLVTFEVEDEEEVLAEKIKQHIWNNLENGESEFTDKQMREDIHAFLRALIAGCVGYSSPMYEGMLKVECDHTLASWFTRNLEMLWT